MSHDHKDEHKHKKGCACSNIEHLTEEQFAEIDMDAGSKSLANALRMSFSVLKIIMIVLVIFFFGSGVFTVAPDERAMVLRFGKIRGETLEQRVLGPGLHWAIPYPVEEVIKFPGKDAVDTVKVDSFWYNEKGRQGPSLDPVFDGYCLTRNDKIEGVKSSGNDYNIVHLKLIAIYRIVDCELFLRNVFVSEPPAGRNYIDVVSESVDPLVKSLSQDATVTTMVNFTIDEAIKSDVQISSEIQKNLQKKLDMIESGIKVDSIQITSIIWPRQVDDDFIASTKAKNKADALVKEAKGYAQSKLNEAGGQSIYNVVMDKNMGEPQRDKAWDAATGNAREVIAGARAYRTKVVESAKANADYFTKLLPEYRKRPKLVVQRIYQDAIQEVLSNTQEMMISQPVSSVKNREFRVLVNRDPMLNKKQDKK